MAKPRFAFCGKGGKIHWIMRKARNNARRYAAEDFEGPPRQDGPRAQMRAFEERQIEALAGVLEGRHRAPGRPFKFDADQVLLFRNSLVCFMESNWPELRNALENPKSKGRILAALQPYIARKHVVAAYELADFLAREIDSLWEFLNSGRYTRDPRQIANALAGVPQVSWRRSFDFCGKKENSYELWIHERAMRDYLKRKFYGRFVKLSRATTVEEISTIMRGTRTHDRNMRELKRRPEQVLRIFEEGKPRPVTLT
jgi:hypothetical protein